MNGSRDILSRSAPRRHRYLVFAHGILAYYVLAVVVTAHVYFIVELLAPVSPPIFVHIQLITWVVPGLLTAGALFVERFLSTKNTRPDATSALREWAPTLIGLAVFGLWAGGYFLVDAVSGSLSHHSMHTFLDDMVPSVPQSVFVYLTVYPFALLPFVWETNLERSLRTAGAYVTVLTVSFFIMVVYPVDLPHPDPRGPLLTRYALGLLYAADPSWNCFPSSHCAVVMTAALSLWHQGKIKGIYGLLVALAIGMSTVLSRQHYVLDALAGFGLAIAVHFAFFRFKGAQELSRRIESKALQTAKQRLDRTVPSR